MCGICGIFHLDGSPIELGQLARMTQSLRHRGPDDEGYFLANTFTDQIRSCGGDDTLSGLNLPRLTDAGPAANLAIGFRRLSILDLSAAGHQPMSTADGRFTLALNGEIYNYVELRDALAANGSTFRSSGDCEVLLHALARQGTEMLARLVGMFAIALYDRQRRSLLLARDFLGIKPLYYAAVQGRFAFASEIEPLQELPWVSRTINPQRAFNYLRFGLTDDGGDSLFADIKQVPAGRYLAIAADGVCAPVCYWRIDPAARTAVSFAKAADTVRELFLDSVKLHLRSDVPLGACLSGGIDSSAIVCAMRRLEPALDIHAFSYCADDPSLDEEKWADLVARRTGAHLHKIRLSPATLFEQLPQLMHSQGEPFGSTSIAAQHCVFRAAAQHGIKVMLDGQGADEMLAGYRPYIAARLASLVRAGAYSSAVDLLLSASKLPGARTREFVMQAAGLLLPADIQDQLRPLIGRQRTPRWLNADWCRDRGVRFDLPWAVSSDDPFREKLVETFTRTSLPMLLRFEDRNSMTHSIESRVPFLTPALVSYVFSLPPEYLIDRCGMSKSVFRAAMRGIVPDEVLDRRDKIGFATPERDWMNQWRPWVGSIMDSMDAAPIPLLDSARIRREADAMMAGRARFDFRLWRWVNFIEWARRLNVDWGRS